MARTMLTTSDNNFNPFTQYREWKAFDEVICGYYSSAYVGRIVALSPNLSPGEMDRAIEDAINEIIEFNEDLTWISPATNKETHYVKFIESDPNNTVSDSVA